MTKLRPTIALAFISLIFVMCSGRADASITMLTLTPSSLITTHGSTAGSVTSMRTLDESGVGSNPSKYVQFRAKTAKTTYAGYRTYTLPASISTGSIIAIQVQANYLGLAKSAQTWTWQIYDWKHKAYVTVGDNYFAPNNAPLNNGPWTILSFNLGGNNLANYVSPGGQILLQTVSGNAAGDADIDYEAVIVTRTSTPPPISRAFYVSTIGNDHDPGTLAMPWRTICKAAKCNKTIQSPVGPGSTVYVRGGIYHEQVVVGVSGSAAGGYVQFQSYPGENAIVDGSGVVMPASNGAPNGLFQLSGRNYVVIQGFEVRTWITNSDTYFPAGIAITGTGFFIQILHNKIHGIENNFCASNQTCCGDGSCNGGAHGVAAYGTTAPNSINHLVIDGNELYGLVLGQSESMPMNGNVEGWSITNNIVHDNNNIGIDAIGFEGVSIPNSPYDQARDGYIGGNLVYNIDDRKNPAYFPSQRNGSNGIYVDGGTRIIIERNIIHHDNVGLELASEIRPHVTSYVTARNNLIYLNTAPGVAIGGHDIPGSDPNNPDCCGSTDHCAIVNNTLLENDTTPNDGSGEFIINYFPKNVSGNIFENNLVVANSQGVLINNGFSNPLVKLDNNLYYAPNGDPTNNTWIWNNVTYSDYSTYQMDTGNDMHSPFDNPLFLTFPNPNLPSLFVRPTSHAGDAGANLGSSVVGATDLAGFSRILGGLIDIGAYQQ